MKKLLLLLLVVGLFLLTACDFKVTVNGSGEKVEPVVQSVQKSDEELLDYFNENISIVEDRKEFFDNSGELYCYVEKDYLETSSDDPALKRIATYFGKQELSLPDFGDGMIEEMVRVYPEDVYFDTKKLSVGGVHNGVVTIYEDTDWWWGSPHSYPNFYCYSFDMTTGDGYVLPADLVDEIYSKAADACIEIAKENDYAGLMGDYYTLSGDTIEYMIYDEANDGYTIDELKLKEAILELLDTGCVEIKSDVIKFYVDAGYNLCDWASRGMYSTIEIPNEWDI